MLVTSVALVAACSGSGDDTAAPSATTPTVTDAPVATSDVSTVATEGADTSDTAAPTSDPPSTDPGEPHYLSGDSASLFDQDRLHTFEIDLDPDHSVLRVVRRPVRQDPSTPASDVDEYVVGADTAREDPAERDMVTVLMVAGWSSWAPPRSNKRAPTANVDKRIASAPTQVDRRLQPLRLSPSSHSAT